MFSKFKKFLSYPKNQKISTLRSKFARFLFSRFKSFTVLKSVAVSHLPDSVLHASEHQEIFHLYPRFSMHNNANNGGDIQRLISFVLNIKQCVGVDNIAGDFAEVGVWRGNTAAILSYYASLYGRHCYLFDTFEGFSDEDIVGVDSQFGAGQFNNTSIEMVKEVIGGESLENCTFIKGYFPESINSEVEKRIFAVVSLDCDLYKPMKAGLDWFYARMTDGSIFLLHDYSSGCWNGSKQAIDEFCCEYKQRLILIPDKSGSAFIRLSM